MALRKVDHSKVSPKKPQLEEPLALSNTLDKRISPIHQLRQNESDRKLDSRNNSMKRTIDQKSTTALQTEILVIKEQLYQCEMELRLKQQDNQEQKQRSDQFQVLNVQLEREIKNMKQDHEKVLKEVADVRKKAQILTDNNIQLQTELDQAKTEIERVSNRKAQDHNKYKEALESLKNKSNSKIKELKDRLKETQVNQQQQQEEMDELRDQIKESESQLSDLQNTHKHVIKSLEAQYRKQMDQLESSLISEQRQAEQNILKSNEQIIEEKQSYILDLQKEIRSIKDQLLQTQLESDKKYKQILFLEEQSLRSENECDQLINEIEQLNSQLHDCQVALKSKDDHITKLLKKIKYQLQLQAHVKDLIEKEYVDLQNPSHFEIIVGILNKAKQQKSSNDLQVLAMAFSSIKFFNEMSKTTSSEELLNLYRELTYVSLPAKRTVFHFGDIGKNFYIIIKGSVWVLVAKAGLSDGQYLTGDNKKVEAKKLHRQSLDEGQIDDENEFNDLTDDDLLAHKYPGMVKVGQVETEGSFGEIALTNFIPRQATIVCREETHFIKLSREAFKKFLSEYYNRIQQRNFEFLKSIQIFQHWQNVELTQIQYYMEPLEFVMNTCIYREGEINKGVYFIIEGYAEISENLVVAQKRDSLKTLRQGQKMQINLQRLGPGQVMGFHEFIMQIDHRQSKAICISEKIRVLFLSSDHFKKYVQQGETLEQLILITKQSEINKKNVINIRLNRDQSFQQSQSDTNNASSIIIDKSDINIEPRKSVVRRSTVRTMPILSLDSESKFKIQMPSMNSHVTTKSQNKQLDSLSFESPLFDVSVRRQPVVKDFIRQERNYADNKQFLIQQLKLPKIIKSKGPKETVQLLVQRYVKKQLKGNQHYEF